MLKFIGNGSAFNVERGNNSAFHIVENRMLLIDCGASVFERIIKANLLEKISYIDVLITHTHDDHIGSLSSLILYMYYSHGEFARPKVTVHASNRIEVSKLLKLNGTIEGEHYFYNKLLLNKSNYIGNYSVIPVQSIHVAEIPSNSFIISREEISIFYSGDLNTLHKVDRANINLSHYDIAYIDTCKADYEGNVHLSLRKLAELINPEVRHKVYCMHLDNGFDVEEAEGYGFNVTKNIFE